MAQVFHPSTNTISKFSIVGGLLGLTVFCTLWFGFNLTYGNRLYVPLEQPVQFSHKHHVKDDGIDCRYCHTSVDKSSFANIPPTETCMTCHSQIWSDSPLLEPVRESWRTGRPIAWTRVHDLPDFVYFNHSIHVQKGVSCVSCHGQVDEMPITWRAKTLTMSWCLDCHKDPAKNLRPRSEVYNLSYVPPANQPELGAQLVREYHVLPRQQLTNCSICHR
ncbi:MAG: cytochrome c3 family protein [Abitibacteriaceae bacterium]|nr:cytochrome c3 family protein [Abditibacteriaceae bacterium]